MIEGTTFITIPNDSEEPIEVQTNRRKWINKMVALEEQGLADEIELDGDAVKSGIREWVVNQEDITLVFPLRKPREMSEKQREEARKRLARVREEVQDSKPKKSKKGKGKSKKQSAPEPEDEVEVEEDEDLELDIEDEEENEPEPETVVKRKRRKGKKGKK